MILRREHLSKQPSVFRAMTGLTVELFDHMLPDLLAAFAAQRRQRLDRPGRQRAFGGGDDFDLSPADQLLLTIVWLRPLTGVNRHGRRGHAVRVRAVAGLVNRTLEQKAA